MKLLKSIIVIMALTCISIDAKRPPKLPKEPKTPLSSEQKQAIVAGAAQVMSSVLTIVQNPHDKHNVGNSVASILHGFINILVEKIGKRKIDFNDIDAIEECIEQICQELSEHITRNYCD
jgi:hypothetical protein